MRTADFESDASRREPAQAPASGLWDQSPLAERNGPENEPVRNPLAASAGGAATQATTDALLGSVPRMRPGTLPPGMENASYAEQVDEILRRWEIERMQDALALEHARQKKAELAREEAARTQALSRIRTVSNEDPTHSLFDGPGLVPVSGSSGLLAQDDSAGAEPSLAPGLGAQPDLPAQQPQGLPRFDRLPGENGEENLRPGIGIEYPQLSDNQPKNRHPMRDFALIQPYNDYSPQEVALCPEDGARCPRYWDLPDTTQPERYHGHLEFYWQPSNLFYQPLYFEDPHLERYGHNYGFFQPLVSVGRFGVQLVGLPYQMALHPPCECVSPLGYYRPGECAPKQRDAVPLNAGAAVESGIIYTAIGVGFPF